MLGKNVIATRYRHRRFVFPFATPSFSQDASSSPSSQPKQDVQATGSQASTTQTIEITVEGRQDSLLGIGDSASQGTVGAAEIQDRPILRSGEILETIPGVIITQ